MENSNLVGLNIDLSSEQGKAIFLAVAAIISGGAKSAAPKPAAEEAKVVNMEAPKAAAPAPAPKPAAAPKAAAPAPAPKAEETVDFDTLDEDGQRNAIGALITRHSKKGKTADIKALLTAYGVTRGSELTAEYLPSFYDSIVRFGNGETVEDIVASFGEADNLN